jgi:hypothetical protein
MPDPNVETDTSPKPPDGSPPSEPNSEGGNGTPPADPLAALSKSQLRDHPKVKALLTGQGKALTQLEKELNGYREAEEKRKQAELSEAERRAQSDAKVAELEAWKTARLEAEQAELAEVSEENEAQIKALPDTLKALVPAGKWLRAAAKQVQSQTIDVHGAHGRAPNAKDAKQQHDDHLAGRANAFLFGEKK